MIQRGLWLIGGLLLWAYLSCLDGAPLLEGDEAIYASLVRGIVDTGHWLNPPADGRDWFDKPPLSLWFQAASISLFGINLTALRLPMVLLSLGSGAIVYYAARVIGFTRVFAVTASFLYLACPGVFSSARDAKFDACFMFFQNLALLGLLLTTQRRRDVRVSLLIAVGCFGAFFTKSLVGLLLPGLAWVLANLARRSLRELFRWDVVVGFALSMVPMVIYIVYMTKRFGDAYVDEQLIWSQLQRATRDRTREMNIPPLFYWHTFLWASLPVAVAAYWAYFSDVWAAFKKRVAPPDERILLGAFGTAYFLLFGLAKSKLPHYIYPVSMAATLLAVPVLERMWTDARFGVLLRRLILPIFVLATVLVTWLFWPSEQPWNVIPVAALLFIVIASSRSADARLPYLAVFAAAACLYCGLINGGLSQFKVTPRVVRALAAMKDVEILTLGDADLRRSFEFHRPTKELRVVSNPEGALEQLMLGSVVLCQPHVCDYMRASLKDGQRMESTPIPYFLVSAVTTRFLWPPTRDSQLRTLELVRLLK